MVYTYTMGELRRTQIYLTQSQLDALERLKKETGANQSELVRRAVDRAYLGRNSRTREERLAILRSAAGTWAGRRETGADFVERLRSGRVARMRDRHK